jgi:hypothetical protein
MSTIDGIAFLPRWTKRVRTDGGGRDPLGLSRVTEWITDHLLQGIITTTDRARYYSFYCWSLWHIQHTSPPRKFSEFIREFRRREAFMALSTIMANSEASPVGVRMVGPKLEAANRTGVADCDFKVLPSNDLGGYGQYYGGSLIQLGLAQRLDGIDLTTPEVGEPLALAFHKAVEGTPYLRKARWKDREVDLKEIKQSAANFSLDSLLEPFASTERDLLREIFFSINSTVKTERSTLRRHSLGLILHIISEYERSGAPVTHTELEWQVVHAPHYFRQLWLTDSKTVPYAAPEGFRVCDSFWQQFSLHQFIANAIETLLYAVLELLSSEPSGLFLEQICSQLIAEEFRSEIRDIAGKPCDSPRMLLATVGIDAKPTASFCRRRQAEFGLLHPRSELKTVREVPAHAGKAAARAVLTLATLYSKWRAADNEAFAFVTANAGNELSAGRVLPYLDEWLLPSCSWQIALERLIADCVIDQHDRVMYEKSNLESRWLDRQERRIIKEQDYDPPSRSSRQGNAIRILSDIGLLHSSSNDYRLTADGRKLLNKISTQ